MTLVPADRSIRLARELKQGRTFAEVGEITGLSHTAVRLLVIGATSRVYPDTEARLLEAASR